MADDICSHGRPNHQDQIRELREAAGLFAGAMPITPKQAWDEAIVKVTGMRDEIKRLKRIMAATADRETR